MRRLKKIIGLVLSVVMLFSFMPTNVFANASKTYTVYFDNISHTIEDDRYQDYDITVYCMNNQLNWPHELYGNQPPDYIGGYLEPKDIQNYDEMIEKLEKVLYAGYPFNSKKLYELISSSEIHTISKDDFNKLLIPTPDLLKAFPYLGQHNFNLDNYNQYKDILTKFTSTVFNMKSTDTIYGLTKAVIMSTPFFKAIMCVFNSDDPLYAFTSWYSASYYVTDKQAYDATQLAVWKILYDYKVEDNSINDISYNQLAVSLYNYANSNDKIPENLPAEDINLIGDFNFIQGDDGKWYSGSILVEEPEYYTGVYELELPYYISVVDIPKDEWGYTTLYGNREYTLVSDHYPEYDEYFFLYHSSHFSPVINQYSPAEPIKYNDKLYQNMVGIYLEPDMIYAEFLYSDVATGKLTVSKNVIGDNDPNKNFTFTVNLSDTSINGDYGDMTFKNGVATFDLKSNDSLTATDLPVGITYTVYESNNDGYTVESQNATGTINGNKPAYVSFTNTKTSSSEKTYGSLVVDKTVLGNAADTEELFEFTVTLSDNTINGTYGDMEFINGVATFKLKHKESKSATGLPVDIQYIVSETITDNGYTVEYEGEKGVINANQTSVASFTNIKNLTESPIPTPGILSVKKEVAGNAADKTKEFPFKVTLSDTTINGTYGDMEFINGVATFNLIHNNPKTATGLPAGIYYSVSELDSYGYTQESMNATGYVVSNEWITAIFTNTLNITTGDILVKKIIENYNINNHKDEEFSFTVTLSDTTINDTYGDMEFINGVAKFTLKHNESKTAKALPAGITYTVREASMNGYTQSYENNIGTIVANKTIDVTFTNTPSFGSISVQKVISGTDVNTNKEFNFTLTLSDNTINDTYSGVEFKDGVATFKLKHNESKLIEGLPRGIKYTVTEDVVEGYTQSAENNTGTITANQTKEVKFTNTPSLGNISVQKIVSGDNADTNKEFTFTLTLSDTTINDTYGDMEFINGVAKFTLKHNESKTAKALPAGITYTVTEASVDGYTQSAENSTGTISENNTINVKFTNTSNKQIVDDSTGKLRIQKTISGDNIDNTKEFKFTLTLSDKNIDGDSYGMNFENGVATFTLKHGDSKEVINLPSGITYTVTEHSVNGYSQSAENNTGTIDATQPIEVKFINTPSFGNILIKKFVSSSYGDTNKDFKFTLTLSDKTINDTYSGIKFTDGIATFTLKHDEYKEIEGLPSGIKYTVTEDVIEGYTQASENNTGTINAGETVEVLFKNIPDLGAISVNKIIPNNNIDGNKDFNFTLTLSDTSLNGTYGDMTFQNGVATFTLKAGESKKAKYLPDGLTYTVTEDMVNGYTQNSENNTGTIAANKTIDVTFTNTPTSGNISIKKIISGDDVDTNANFNFTLTLSDTSINGKYGDITFVNGIATFKIKHDHIKVAVGLPANIKYIIAEEYNNNYSVSSINATGIISENQTIAASFTNTKVSTQSLEPSTGSLSVKKIVDGTSEDTKKEFVFSVKLSNKDINGTYGDMEFENGVATFSLKHNQIKTATNIPEGIDYEVIENKVDGYTVVAPNNKEGTITANTNEFVTYKNTAVKLASVGNISVRKVISGDYIDTAKEFTFTLTLSDTSINGLYGDMNFENDVATFNLKHNKVKMANNLPKGITYKVEEKSVDGYSIIPVNEKGTVNENNTIYVTFTNTLTPETHVGSISVKKVLFGDDTDITKEFNFTLTLSDTSINGLYGDMNFENGVATFNLKHNESKVATNIPKDIEYEVKENNTDGYNITPENEKGTITENNTINVTFTNTKIKEPSSSVGDLSIQKIVDGTDEDKEKNFSFTLTLSDTTIDGNYGDIIFENGVAIFTLKHDEFKIAKGLPANINYTIVENYDSNYAVNSNNTSGFIVANETIFASFKNSKISNTTPKPTTASLTVKKIVIGNESDNNKPFTFTVTLSDNKINGTYGDMFFQNGIAIFKLKPNESKSATELPIGITYTVTESDNEGYTIESRNASGSINTDNIVVEFKNNWSLNTDVINKSISNNDVSDTYILGDNSPSTGDSSNIILWISLVLLSTISLALLITIRHNTKKKIKQD